MMSKKPEDLSYMTEEYIRENIFPLLKKKRQRESRDFWVAMSTDKNNPHQHQTAMERIKYIDEHPDEYPYPWMSPEPGWS